MKVEKKHTISLFDIDEQYRIRLQSVAHFFQDVATHHSAVSGVGFRQLMDRGVVWFLHRLEIEFLIYPEVDEEVVVRTWSRGFKRFKGFREFEMCSSRGVLVRGTSVWIFFDLKRNRISTIPDEISRRYEPEPDAWFKDEIDAWIPPAKIEMEDHMQMRLRHSDFDVNGHMNNTIYLGFAETLYHEVLKNQATPFRNIKIRYVREIDRNVRQVIVGWQPKGQGWAYNIMDDDGQLFADGEIIPYPG